MIQWRKINLWLRLPSVETGRNLLRPPYLLLPLLSLYILGGLKLAPFHADEAIHLWLARDYVIYAVLLDPQQMSLTPPVAIDSEAHMRLLSGTVSAYSTGFILWHSGQQNLENWHPPWYFPESPAQNRAAGRYPPDQVLWWGRLASGLYLAGSVWVIFGIGRFVQGDLGGMCAAMIFALHPVILLNGRRVMQEGALIFFSLLLIYQTLRLLQKPTHANYILWGMIGGLALASKPTALIILISMGVSLVWGLKRQITLPQLCLVGAHSCAPLLLIYLFLTPAIWQNPLAHSRLAAQLRAEALAGQAEASGQAYHSLEDRFLALLKQPFPSEIQYYESPAFAEDAPLHAQITHYEKKWLRGINFPALIGWILAGIGLYNLRQSLNSSVILLWGGITGVSLVIAIPMAWQRYYLPWTVAINFLAGVGLAVCLELLWRKYQKEKIT